jgi:hypothetical protein
LTIRVRLKLTPQECHTEHIESNFVSIYILQDTYRTKSNFSYSAHLAGKHPIFRKYSVNQVELQGFEYDSALLRGHITNEERYDLWQLEEILVLPCDLFIIDGKRLVGSAIRICKAIGKPEHADTFHQIVEGCFAPHEHQDPKDSARDLFGLHVEPSTGGIQCNCCKDEE